jgi:hypothetical protein
MQIAGQKRAVNNTIRQSLSQEDLGAAAAKIGLNDASRPRRPMAPALQTQCSLHQVFGLISGPVEPRCS